jgi:serine/threonine protein kinase
MTNQYLNDRYEIVQQLGKRTGRETLLARDLSTEKLVVIKLLKFNSEFEWDDLKLFEREAQTLQDLSHPQIPQYLDFFEFEVPQYKGFALVQTYLEAKSLEQHRESGRTFAEDEVKQIAEQLLEILSYLHDRHPPVIHRDLKPSNILLGDRSAHSVGKIYLVDFGSVQNMAAMEGGTFTVVGTYGYMPPEQFGGRTVPASDLYSLGATLIYLLTGQHPADLPQKNLQIDIAKVAKLSPNFGKWLEAMLEPSLDRRFSSSQSALKVLYTPETNTILSERDGKPAGSKISIFKDLQELTIILSEDNVFCSETPISTIEKFAGFVCYISFFICFFLIFSLFHYLIFTFYSILFFITLSVVSLFCSLLFSLAVKYFVLCVLRLVLWVLRFDFRVTIKLDQKNFTIIKLKNKISFPISTIVKIEKILPYINRSIIEGDTSKRSAIDTLSGTWLVIWVGTTRCNIQHLSEPEVDWLGAELSDWLGLPIKHRDISIIESYRPCDL